MYQGYVTQAFQKLVLQWRPELGAAMPLNVLDELNGRALDGWLESNRQVPQAVSNADDVALDWEVVVARHTALLDAYPDLRFWFAETPDAVDIFGLPLALHDYGAFVAVRLQRATLQLYRATDGATRITIGNAGDLAKEVGLWPPEATIPTSSTTAAAEPE